MVAARTGAICVGTERTVAAIRTAGLTLVHNDTTTVSHPTAVERLDVPVSLLVVAVKAYHLEAALERVPTATLDGAIVLPLLNGLEHVDALRRRFRASDTVSLAGPPAVAAGSIGRVEAFSPEPGLIVQRTPAYAVVEVASRDVHSQALAEALAPLRVPGIDIVAREDERAVLWNKAARLAVLAAATTASGRTVGELRDDATWRGRLLGSLEESVAVACAEGVALSAAEQWGMIAAMPPDLTTSTARDAAAGRLTELDAITGSVVRAADRLGVDTPVLRRLLEEATCRAA
jgi:2-dehydropantoate 2-reductase